MAAVSFGEGPNSVYMPGAGGSDSYVATYDESGSFVWARSAGGPAGDVGFDVAVGTSGTAYVTGFYAEGPQGNTAVFPDESTSMELISVEENDMFLAAYGPTGDLLWAKSFGGPDREDGFGIAVDSQESVFFTGAFEGTMSFGADIQLTSARSSSADVFLAKVVQDPVTLIEQLIRAVLDLNANEGIESSIDAKLEAAARALSDANENNDIAACNALNALLHALDAQVGTAISDVDAAADLVEATVRIMQLLDCP